MENQTLLSVSLLYFFPNLKSCISPCRWRRPIRMLPDTMCSNIQLLLSLIFLLFLTTYLSSDDCVVKRSTERQTHVRSFLSEKMSDLNALQGASHVRRLNCGRMNCLSGQISLKCKFAFHLIECLDWQLLVGGEIFLFLLMQISLTFSAC